MIPLKQRSAIAQVSYSIKCKYRVSKALKHAIHSEEFRKYIWTIAVKIYFTNINSFTKVTWLLQNKYLQLLQFNIGQKGRQRVLQVLNHKTHSEELWKYIWTIGVKIFFKKNGSFTKVMRLLLNCDLQLLQFGIRQKCQ